MWMFKMGSSLYFIYTSHVKNTINVYDSITGSVPKDVMHFQFAAYQIYCGKDFVQGQES